MRIMYFASNLLKQKRKPKTIRFSAFEYGKELRIIFLIDAFLKFRQPACLKAKCQIVLF